MASSLLARKKRAQTGMGQIYTSITVTNSTDLDNAESGLIEPSAVRTVELGDVLPDSGATYLCLPIDVIERLGLHAERTVPRETAAGLVEAKIFRNARVALMGRVTVGVCVELAVGARVLLGAMSLEALGIELDLQNRTLRLLPESGPRGYIYA
ncbi:MAG: aspartyl protease [Dehalococcoidia bacterium]